MGQRSVRLDEACWLALPHKFSPSPCWNVELVLVLMGPHQPHQMWLAIVVISGLINHDRGEDVHGVGCERERTLQRERNAKKLLSRSGAHEVGVQDSGASARDCSHGDVWVVNVPLTSNSVV